jgi:DNA-binding response OmpR family regulator
MKILLLEDDKLLNDAICRYLHAKGHDTTGFRNGLEVLEVLQNEQYDLLILDISVPGIDGLTLLEKLQRFRVTAPVIFISAIVDIEDISRAFDLGCHDYLKKPFHLKELALRIDKILQTHYVAQAHVRLSVNYSFDSEKSQLYFQNEVQILSKRQLEIIELLARNRSRVVTYDMFRDYVYGDDMIDVGTIRAEVNRLKKVLKEDIIINIRGIGYMIERPK